MLEISPPSLFLFLVPHSVSLVCSSYILQSANHNMRQSLTCALIKWALITFCIFFFFSIFPFAFFFSLFFFCDFFFLSHSQLHCPSYSLHITIHSSTLSPSPSPHHIFFDIHASSNHENPSSSRPTLPLV